MVGAERAEIKKEVEDLLTEEEIRVCIEEERIEKYGNIPQINFVEDLYKVFFDLDMQIIRDVGDDLGFMKKLKESSPDSDLALIDDVISHLVNEMEMIFREAENDRGKITEAQRLSGPR